MNDQQKEYLKRRRKQLAKRLQQASEEMKYTEALREVKKITSLCKHCDAFIRFDKVFGWYHGELAGGWNTTCKDGEASTRAEPMADNG